MRKWASGSTNASKRSTNDVLLQEIAAKMSATHRISCEICGRCMWMWMCLCVRKGCYSVFFSYFANKFKILPMILNCYDATNLSRSIKLPQHDEFSEVIALRFSISLCLLYSQSIWSLHSFSFHFLSFSRFHIFTFWVRLWKACVNHIYHLLYCFF